ncbi:MAG: hypothetical protein WCP79_06920 [Bacillota bacterium]
MHRHETFKKFVDNRVLDILNDIVEDKQYREKVDALSAIENNFPLKIIGELNNAQGALDNLLHNEIYAKAFKDGYEMKKLMGATI